MCADIVNHEEEVISVGQLNQQAKRLLENQFRGIAVLGEISNLARPSSGCLLYTSPSPRDVEESRMPSSA